MTHRKNTWMLVVGLCIMIGLAGPGSAPGQPLSPEVLRHPELILHSGKIITVDQAFSIQEAVAIRDGRFLAVGSNARIRGLAGPGTRQIDLRGRAVIPGLIDSHIHMLRAGFRWPQEVRLDEIQSIDGALSAVGRRAGEIPAGQWIITLGGWHESQLREGRLPTRQELDRVAPNHPVYLQSLLASGVLNTRGLQAASITRDTPAPRGGVVEKDAGGEPTGVLRGAPALRLVAARLPRPTFEEKVNGLRAVMRDFNRVGLTGAIEVVGGAVNDEDYQVLFELWRRKGMTIRTSLNILTDGLEAVRRWIRHSPGRFGDDMLKINGFGEIVTWAFFDGVAPQFPIAPDKVAEFKQIVAEIARNRWHLQIHSVLDSTISHILDAFEEANQRWPIRDLRFNLAHIEEISDRNLDRMKALGVGATIQDRQIIQGTLMQRAWGSRAQDGPPLRKLMARGIPVAGGTDTTVVAPYNPFLSLWWLVTGKMLRGDVIRPRERLSREEALRVYTMGSAWASFDEARKGSIEPGKLADLVVLNEDYLTIPEDRIRAIRPLMTIVDGQIVYDTGL
ncbi:MAG: amidohydrolase [Deltaproteobacteria bacterium]|nr:amidohydrolase [Deltaproteobacteria bacterium]